MKPAESRRLRFLAGAVFQAFAVPPYPQASVPLLLAPDPPPGPPVPLAGGVQNQVYNGSTITENANGPSGRSVTFSVAAGQVSAVFPSSQISISTGSVAGTITLTLHFESNGQDVTPQPAPMRVIQLPPAAPTISQVTASTTAGGIEVDVIGLSNTRDMASATFQFQAASGTTLQGGQTTLTVDQLFAGWFGGTASLAFGGQFRYAQPFTITGSMSGVTGVTVTLTNKQGTSSAVSAGVP